MAQRQYVKWKDPLRSWTQNTSFFGLFNPGRYCGYDTMEFAGILSMKLKHSGTGVVVVDPDDIPQQPYGMLVSKQGVYIVEDAEVGPLTLVTNSGNDYIRYDAVIATHSYVATAGNNPAVYSIITGALGSPATGLGPIPPTLTDPSHQVLIGLIEIQPGANGTDNTKFRWIPMNAPDTGDDRDAKLGRTNTFSQTNQWRQSPSTLFNVDNSSVSLGDGYWLLPTDGNTYTVAPVTDKSEAEPRWFMRGLKFRDIPQQSGSRIRLIINQRVRIISEAMGTLDSSNYAYMVGYRPIFIPGEFGNELLNDASVLRESIKSQPDHNQVQVELELMDNTWVVVDAKPYKTTKPQITPFAVGTTQLLPIEGPIPWKSGINTYPGAGDLVSDAVVDAVPGLSAMRLPPQFTYGFQSQVHGTLDFASLPFVGGNVTGATRGAENFTIKRAGFLKAEINYALALSFGHIATLNKENSTIGAIYVGVIRTRNNVPELIMASYYPENHTYAQVTPAGAPSTGTYSRSVATLHGSLIVQVQAGDLIQPAMLIGNDDQAKSTTYRPKAFYYNPARGLNHASFMFLGDYPLLYSYTGKPGFIEPE